MKLIYILLVILPGCSAGQTCIIAKLTKDAIYVGADRLFRFPNKDSSFYGNKIYKIGKYYMASSGIQDIEIRNLMNLSFSANVILEKKDSIFKANIIYILNKKYPRYQAYKKMYRANFLNRPLQIFVFGAFRGKLFIYQTTIAFQEFAITNNGVSFATNEDIKFDWQYRQNIIGYRDAIDREVSETEVNKWNEFWLKHGEKNGMKKLIKIAHEGNPGEVSKEFNLIKVTVNGAQWLK